jgi:hypothetical protein
MKLGHWDQVTSGHEGTQSHPSNLSAALRWRLPSGRRSKALLRSCRSARLFRADTLIVRAELSCCPGFLLENVLTVG